MATLDDDPEYIKVLYYGDYGTGKTTCLAHMAKLGTVKYIRTDNGLKARPLRALGVPTGNIEPIDQTNPVSVEAMIEEWRAALDDDPKALAGVVIDTATEWVAQRIGVYVDADWRKLQSQAKRQHVELDPMLRFTAGDNQDQYNAVTQEIRRIARVLYSMPIHVGYGCQVRRDVDKDSGQTKYGPSVNPALQGTLIGFSDVVIRLEPEGEWDDGRALIVGYPRPDSRHIGKDRLNVLPKRLADPTLDRIHAYATGELNKEIDPVQAEYRNIVRRRKKEDEL